MSFLHDMGVEFRMDHFNSPAKMKNTHVHNQYELYFCPDDVEQESVINGVKYSYKYPCAILSTPYTVHSMSCAEPTERYERYVFYFGSKTIDSFNDRLLPKGIFGGNTGVLFRLTPEEAEELKYIVSSNEKDRRADAETELMFALFINRLIALCPPERIEKVGMHSFYIQDVLQYISEHFNKDMDAEAISKHFMVSRSKLDRDFKKFTGNTIHNYVNICRVNQAKYMLQYNRELTIGEIAVLCGFKSETYFFPFFKKVVGVTPSEYRKNL